LATELPSSKHYTSDGYWRGPIWAPCTMIAVDGLTQLGERKLAREIAGRFCRLCAKSAFAENFDALTGAPLRDTAYTWTSSVFLVLANSINERR
jgi:glycogen debranching enzyme